MPPSLPPKFDSRVQLKGSVYEIWGRLYKIVQEVYNTMMIPFSGSNSMMAEPGALTLNLSLMKRLGRRETSLVRNLST